MKCKHTMAMGILAGLLRTAAAGAGSLEDQLTVPDGHFSSGASVILPGSGVSTQSTMEISGPPAEVVDIQVGMYLYADNLNGLGAHHALTTNLLIELVGPNGDAIVLARGVGDPNDPTLYPVGSRDFTETVFDDQAASSIAAGTVPFRGSYRPQEPLALLTGQSVVGQWQLRIANFASTNRITIGGQWWLRVRLRNQSEVLRVKRHVQYAPLSGIQLPLSPRSDLSTQYLAAYNWRVGFYPSTVSFAQILAGVATDPFFPYTNFHPCAVSSFGAGSIAVGHLLALQPNGDIRDRYQYVTSVPVGVHDVVSFANGFTLCPLITPGGPYCTQAFPPEPPGELGPLEPARAAVRADGAVLIWGTTDAAVSTIPAGVVPAIDISLGDGFAVAALANGHVRAWGSANSFGELNVPADLSDVVAVACGDHHALALKRDGSVVGWGDSTYGQDLSIAGEDVVAISAWENYSLVLHGDGTVDGFGGDVSRRDGQSVTPYHRVLPPSGLFSVVDMAAGVCSLAVQADGTAVSWPPNTPREIDNAVAAGANCLLRKDIAAPRLRIPRLRSFDGFRPVSFDLPHSGNVDRFGAIGLPAGLTLNPVTGVVTGQVAASRLFKVWFTASNEFGVVGQPMVLAVGLDNRFDLAEAVEQPARIWTSFGDQIWAAQGSTTHDGIDAAQGTLFGPGQRTVLSTKVNGPAVISFWARLLTVGTLDQFHVDFRAYVDGLPQPDFVVRNSGFTNMVMTIAAGAHVVTWELSTQAGFQSPTTSAWVDEVTIGTADDLDGDGIPNVWEIQHGLNPSVANSSSADADRDGFTDLQEYIADTNPTNAASFLRLSEASNGPPGALVLAIAPSSTDRLYGVHVETNLLFAGQQWPLQGGEQTGTGSRLAFIVTNVAPHGFYRTGVRLP